jgi:hypothetical protein
MSHQKNQHWVPKYYFRSFHNNSDSIHVLLIKNGRLIFNAPVKGQCAKNNFYGSVEIEQLFSRIEADHAPIIRKVKRIAWANEDLTEFDRLLLLQAVFFQRSRTELELERDTAASEKITMYAFRHYVACAPDIDNREELLHHLDSGNCRIVPNPHWTILSSIASHMDSMPLVSDLEIYFIRNETDWPFIFGDSPVVFYNSLYRDVSSRGVLGLTTPGLQVFLPIDSRTAIMLLDGSAYRVLKSAGNIISLTRRSDISQLNALQLHNSLNAAYFADVQHGEYVGNLWQAHSKDFQKAEGDFHIRHNWLVDDEPIDEILHTFRPQLNYRIDLSFVSCTPVKDSEFVFRRRSPELFQEFRSLNSELT